MITLHYPKGPREVKHVCFVSEALARLFCDPVRLPVMLTPENRVYFQTWDNNPIETSERCVSLPLVVVASSLVCGQVFNLPEGNTIRAVPATEMEHLTVAYRAAVSRFVSDWRSGYGTTEEVISAIAAGVLQWSSGGYGVPYVQKVPK
jgi:hypothetical protein